MTGTYIKQKSIQPQCFHCLVQRVVVISHRAVSGQNIAIFCPVKEGGIDLKAGTVILLAQMIKKGSQYELKPQRPSRCTMFVCVRASVPCVGWAGRQAIFD